MLYGKILCAKHFESQLKAMGIDLGHGVWHDGAFLTCLMDDDMPERMGPGWILNVRKPTRQELTEFYGRAYADWHWAKRLPEKYTRRERVAMILKYRKLRAELNRAVAENDFGVETKPGGAAIYRQEDADRRLGIRGQGERYGYDLRLCAAGWRQYDTNQDAWYFGVWVDVEGRRVFTYAEGDRCLVECPTLESFRAELDEMSRFYGEPPAFAVAISDDGTVTRFVEERIAV